MAAPHGYTSLAGGGTPQGRWRRVLMTTAALVLSLFLYYAYSSDLILPYEDLEPAHSQHLKQPPHLKQISPTSVTSPSNSPSPSLSPPTSHIAPQQHNASQAVPTPPPTPSPSSVPDEGKTTLEHASAGQIMNALARPFLHPIDAANFTADGQVHRLGGEPRFKKKLGKRLLILDVDSRPLNDEGHLMHKELDWKTIKPLSAGILSHHLYAEIHGYDYQLVQAPNYEDRWGTWTKVPFMKEALKTHDYIVFLDSDVMFHYPHLPLEWLLNYWNMTEDTLAMMSIDPDEPQNYDAQGNRFLNTGFVIAQQSERTQEMYKAWAECPEETRYKGCARWKKDWPHEQSAFGNYVRYDFDRPEDFRVLPCAEANGAPEAINRGGCIGTFVRHYWVDKGLLQKGLADFIMQHFVTRMHQSLHAEGSGNIIDAKNFTIDGADLIPLLSEEEKEAAVKEQSKNEKHEGFK